MKTLILMTLLVLTSVFTSGCTIEQDYIYRTNGHTVHQTTREVFRWEYEPSTKEIVTEHLGDPKMKYTHMCTRGVADSRWYCHEVR